MVDVMAAGAREPVQFEPLQVEVAAEDRRGARRPADDRLGGALHLRDAAPRRVEVPDPQSVVEPQAEQPPALGPPAQPQHTPLDDATPVDERGIASAAVGLDRVRPPLGEDAPQPETRRSAT